ncbi:diguanylate cyclase [Oleiagrimonas sp. MCCC 1A03011]|uniref:diguanylate cyclase n=1 Tax=Oleiagrimonas sp. MCCC 1A03011 TaxID=1926883 RepID=UPI000DD9725D|nr:diguanylate cyclase [Oleiagrimonas sp. MCCC 1A03011]
MSFEIINKRQNELRYVEQTYHMRMLGLALGLFPVGAVLFAHHAPVWQWVLLAVYALLWPQAAYLIARSSITPGKTEFRSTLVDATMAGLWLALIHFNALPSLSMIMIMGMALVSSGGWRLMVPGVFLMVLGILLGILLDGFQWLPHSSGGIVLLTIPLLVMYPVAVSAATYRLARHVGRQNQLLSQLSRTDSLTTLPNRHHWQQALTLEFQRFLRTHRPATLVMLDLDGFKQLNDTYGHTVGDDVLRRVADLLHENSRNIDTPGRFGGDEFGLVMPETDRDGARMLMERIRREIEREEFDVDTSLRVTVSIGLAEITRVMSDPMDWIKAADDALYLAKEQGRNRVCTAPYAAPTGALG